MSESVLGIGVFGQIDFQYSSSDLDPLIPIRVNCKYIQLRMLWSYHRTQNVKNKLNKRYLKIK